MAKKRGNNKGNSNSADAAARPSSDDAAPSPPPEEQEQQGGAAEKPVAEMSIEELRHELVVARAEIERLKKAQLPASADKVPKPQEVQELHAKLQQLRKEQQEADAARDKAWKQLKAVVQEISSLANPDYLQSLVVKPQE